MRRFFILSATGLLAAIVACQKQQPETERNAEIERRVNEQLAAEHQAQEQQRLAQRQDELDARVRELSEQQQQATATPQSKRAERPAGEAFEPRPTGSYSVFYTKLEPFGVWRESSAYGFVWQPRAAMESRSWRPYTNGRWVYTDAGWTWISDEPFGWATYHYGRWTRLRGIGWVWVPDTEWAPAWVSWRASNDYVGWAPLPPEAHFQRDTGIRNWADNYYDLGPEQYCFIPTRELGAERIERVVVPQEQNVTIVNQTTNVTNITYNNTIVVNQGPSYDELRARSQQPIARLRLERRTGLATENPRPVVKGEVVEIPAPIITPAGGVERPPVVKETVTETVVEHGWEGIADQRAAQQARAKIKSEATPPPNAPPKTFVKPASGVGQTRVASPAPRPSAPPVARPLISPVPTSVMQPSTATQTARPAQTPMPTRAVPTPVTTSAERGSSTATRPRAGTPVIAPSRVATPRPRGTATPLLEPTSTPLPKMTPVGQAPFTPFAAPSASAPAFSPRPAVRQFSPIPTTTPELSATAAVPRGFGRTETREPRETQKELREQARAERKQERFGAATPTPAISATLPLAGSSPPTGAAQRSGKDKTRPSARALSPTATPTISPPG
ncbi:MAG TPA: DUF6600 domain-containing protein [Chthoniobacterales bacterium]|nr:DUF6600 domain-containing protein [Chthoniobacterales bacterium]